MKYLPLVLAGLWRKPTRTVFTFLSVVVAFILFGILAGLNGYIAHAQETARLDRLFVDARFGSPLPLSYETKIAAVPGVILVAPRMGIGGYWRDPKNGVGVISTDERFFGARSELTATKAEIDKLIHTRTGIIVGTAALKAYGWKVGDKISIISQTAQKNGSMTWTFDILSAVDDRDNPGQAGYVIGNYKYIDEARATGSGMADRFLIRIADPTRASQIGRTIDALFANSPNPTRTTSEKAAAQRGLQSLGDINFFVHAIISAVLFMLLFLTGNTLMQSVRERTSEFAVLKTLGFSDTGVLSLVIAEAVTLCAVAGLMGLLLEKGLSVAAANAATKAAASPNATQAARQMAGLLNLVQISWSAVGTGMVFALGMAVIASLIPAWRVKKLNVVDALAGR